MNAFKQFGRTYVLIAAVITVLAVVFTGITIGGRRGIFEIMGSHAKIETADYSAYRDMEKTAELAQSTRPVITFSIVPMKKQEKTDLGSMFSAADAKGDPATVTIKDITDASGKSLLYEDEDKKKDGIMLQDPSEFVFPQKGAYTIYVKAQDAGNLVTYRCYEVPVN